MPFRDWIELESDPGLFTLLVYDFGVKNVEVEEVYDLSKSMEKKVYGLIFLFKWTEERKSRRKAAVVEENFVFDDSFIEDMFFAQQVIPNSCASHALLSVLLNIPDLNLGHTLKQLRDSTKGFDSETKGLAISNFRNIGIAHNNHGSPDFRKLERMKSVSTATRSMEAFHFVSYIPYKGRLLELDGLKPYPIDHGPWSSEENWTDKARQVIQDRIQLATGGELSHDIRYNLLAVVPEQREILKEKLAVLSHNKKVLIELFKNLASKESFVSELPSPSAMLKDYPPYHVDFPKIEVESSSTHSHSSSTVQGPECGSNVYSDSEDSSVDTYRTKSLLRGTSKPVIYIYGGSGGDTVNGGVNGVETMGAHLKNNTETSLKRTIIDSSNEFCDSGIKKQKQITNESILDSVDNNNKLLNENTCSLVNENFIIKKEELQDNNEINKLKIENETNNEVNENEKKDSAGLGIEIIADDADITSLLDQNKVERLSLDHLMKYQDKIKLQDVQKSMQDLDELYKSFQLSYKEELIKVEKYKVEDCRRRHDYDPFISTFLTMLADQGQIAEVLERQKGVVKNVVLNTKRNGLKKDIHNKKKTRAKSK
ncbi:ubiquitin carboxyl-terminal hydrolase BAP1 isoform X3 [Hydra vulgaris]|uniref:Ubiquitin carboxyl-terminal hydrolase n=2 Tax=Hydra vulgaris TaxID=6087 RepID=A0ABM4DGL7_HYDVU